MYPEAQTPRQQGGDPFVQVGVLLAEQAVAIDDEEDVAERVVAGPAPLSLITIGVDGLDAGRGEAGLAFGQQRVDLGYRPADRFGVAPHRNSAHVRQGFQCPQRAAAEIDAHELHLPRAVGQPL